MEVLQPFPGRFAKRYLKEAAPWARDNILWGALVLVVPPLAEYLQNPHPIIDLPLIKNTLILYAFAFAVYGLARLPFTAKHLDDERDLRERALENSISEKETTIRQREDEIKALREQPKRDPAAQDDYDTAKRALSVVKDKGKKALRFLRNKGEVSLIFRFGSPITGPTPPSGLTLNDLAWVYHHCESEGVVTVKREIGGSAETFAIAPHMAKALQDAIFED